MRRAVARWCAWVIATASASAASEPAIFAPGSSRATIAWTCAFSALPTPTTAFLTSRAAYSPTSIPARAAVMMMTPRAWPSFSVDCGLALTKTSSTAALSGRWSAIRASSCSPNDASRCGSWALVLVVSCPFAMCERRLPSAWIKPQPVVPKPGSRPRILGKLLQLFLRHVVIAPDGLDVVVLFERVDQLHQLLRVTAANFDLGRGLPRELRAFAFAQHAFERAGDFVQRIDADPDAVA